MKAAERQLLADMYPEAGRDVVLRRGGQALRRRRVVRRVVWLAPALVLAALFGFAVIRHREPPRPATAVLALAKPRSLTDEQLFARFPGVPKAIIVVNGQKRLVFPRPGDAFRYVGRAAPPLVP